MGVPRWFVVVVGLAGYPARRGLRVATQAAAVVVVMAALPPLARALPARTGWVTDEARALTPQARQDLDRELDEFSRRTSFEVAVVAVRSLGGKPVEEYSFELARGWKIGKSGLDNGVLVLVAVDDRKMRIETGKGVGHLLTDLESRDILDAVMRPKLKAGDTAGALREGARAVMTKLEGSPQQVAAQAPAPGRPWWHWVLGFFGLMAVLRVVLEVFSGATWRMKESSTKKRTIASSLAVAAKALPEQQEFDRLLGAFAKEPWVSHPVLAHTTRDDYARAFAQHTGAYQKAAREGAPDEQLRQATVARQEATLARQVFDRLRGMIEDKMKPSLRDTFSALDKAHALIAQLDEQQITHDDAGPLREVEALLGQAFRPSGAAPDRLIASASQGILKLLADGRGLLEDLGRQDDALADLARSIETAGAPIGRGEAVFQQFRRDFPAEQEGESPAAHLTGARAALAGARPFVGVRSGEAIARVVAATQEAARRLDLARTAADRAPLLAAEREARKPVLAQRLDELRSLLAQLRQLSTPPQDAIAAIDKIFREAQQQQLLGDRGNLAAALRDAIRAIQLGENARTAASRVASGAVSSGDYGGSSSSYDSGGSSSSYDSGSSSSYDSGGSSGGDSGGSSSGGGGDFGGGGASSDW